jgi:hypothetical protein
MALPPRFMNTRYQKPGDLRGRPLVTRLSCCEGPWFSAPFSQKVWPCHMTPEKIPFIDTNKILIVKVVCGKFSLAHKATNFA